MHVPLDVLGSPRYRIAEVYMFDTCTHRCGYCWLAESGQVLDAAQLKPFRDPAFIERIADFFNSRTTVTDRWTLQFTGGEPLLAPNLASLCRKLFDRGNRAAFYTALLLPEGHPGFRFLLDHQAPDVDYVMASLHPEAEADVDTYFRKVARLKERGHRVIVRYVGHPARLSALDAIDRRCRDLDVCFYPTTLLSNVYPAAYKTEDKAALAAYFTSVSQHIQLRGGLDTTSTTCRAGNRLIAVNLQSGAITPCITVDRPFLGNLFTNTLDLHASSLPCPMPNTACVCDIHFQQAIVDGADDSRAFERQKAGYVQPHGAQSPALHSMTFFRGAEMRIGDVENPARLFFSKDEVRRNRESRRGAHLADLGRWSLEANQRGTEIAVSVRISAALAIVHLELFVNRAPDGSTSGEWTIIYGADHDGKEVDVSIVAALPDVRPGLHRVALNVQFADGRVCYWYNQPPHFVDITIPADEVSAI